MFDKYYSFSKISKRPNQGSQFDSLIFRFKTDNGCTYLVDVEIYQNDIYIVKFYPQKLKNKPNRFNVIINKVYAPAIISTCVQIILHIVQTCHVKSFGFIGSYSESKEDKNTSSTQRFKIYDYVSNNSFGLEHFTHFEDPQNNVFLFIDKRIPNRDEYTETIKKMFTDLYPTLISERV